MVYCHIMEASLLVIDPQNDFCSPNGALFVPGATEDMERLAVFIKNNADALEAVHVTLDCHSYYHIAHPCFWRDQNGNPPAPYTTITHTDFVNGAYLPQDCSLEERVGEYLAALESRGRYQLTVWPPHCLFATEGFAVCSAVASALHDWECGRTGRIANFIEKARNPYTEHYSAIAAEVPDITDPATQTNTALIDRLRGATNIFVAGEALSHCVANTLHDLFSYLEPQNVTLLRDCTSSVTGFERHGEAFVEEYAAKGMRVADSSLRL